MLEAYMCLQESGRSALPVALCLVVGEEEGAGAEKLVEDYDFPSPNFMPSFCSKILPKCINH
jgi:hypothetical protein